MGRKKAKRKAPIDMVTLINTGIPEYAEFEKILRMTQTELKDYVLDELLNLGYNPISEDGFLYAKGNVDILLTAHLDTTTKVGNAKRIAPKTINTTNGVVMSPQGIGGDDRCGVYMILEIIRETKCAVLFCEDEEIGCVGSEKFCKTDYIKEIEDMRYMIELDRKGKQDLVFYSCDNPDFEDWLIDNMPKYNTNWGSCSDISVLMPCSGVAGVNISCGYYDEHTIDERIVLSEMMHTLECVKSLVKLDSPRFEYIEEKYNWNDYYNKFDMYFGGYVNGNQKSHGTYELYVVYQKDGKEYETVSDGVTVEEAFFNFFHDNPTVCMNDISDYYYEYLDY